MEFNTRVKLAVYQRFADTGLSPRIETIAAELDVPEAAIQQSFAELRATRVLFLEPDGRTIRMAPPFSGVPTRHRVEAGNVVWFANCAWDALGIPAALHAAALVTSECGHTGEPLRLEVGLAGPGPSPWVFHSLASAAHWWDDLVFT